MAANREAVSPREREVMMLRAKGYAIEQIAPMLGISEHTARKHRDNAVSRDGRGDQLAVILSLLLADNASA